MPNLFLTGKFLIMFEVVTLLVVLPETVTHLTQKRDRYTKYTEVGCCEMWLPGGYVFTGEETF